MQPVCSAATDVKGAYAHCIKQARIQYDPHTSCNASNAQEHDSWYPGPNSELTVGCHKPETSRNKLLQTKLAKAHSNTLGGICILPSWMPSTWSLIA